ncbi:MAG: phosphatase PAP2 family protein [Casimicrobiaceae bacterium]
MLLAFTSLGVITYEVITHATLAAMDVPAIMWAHAHRSAAITAVAHIASWTGGPLISSAYVAIVVIFCLARHQFATAAGVATIVLGGAGLNVALKHLVQRARPVVDDPLVSLSTYSFPSGHAAATTVFGGLLIMLMFRSRAEIGQRALAIWAIVFWVLCVFASRIYLGAHYPTDVLAGLAEGIGWLALSSLVLDRWRVPLIWPRRRAL